MPGRAEILEHLRAICMSFPEATERMSHGEPTWFVRDKKVFVMFDDHHHGADHIAIWCPAPPGVQGALVDEEPNRFFVPPYVGHRGWVGVRLDVEVDWDEVARIAADSYRMVAPKKLIAELDSA
ncbi:MAG: hypothetical protein QOD38_375 [Acidimicrobiaceae bacterium]